MLRQPVQFLFDKYIRTTISNKSVSRSFSNNTVTVGKLESSAEYTYTRLIHRIFLQIYLESVCDIFSQRVYIPFLVTVFQLNSKLQRF